MRVIVTDICRYWSTLLIGWPVVKNWFGGLLFKINLVFRIIYMYVKNNEIKYSVS